MVSQHALAKISAASPSQLMTSGPCLRPVEEVARLERILSPATREERLATIEKLMVQFQVTAPARKEDQVAQINGYLLAMEGYPFWAIIDAGTAFVRGQVVGHNPAFMPKPAEIGREVATRADSWRMKLGLARKRVAEEVQLGPEVRAPTSDSVREQAARRVAELRAAAEADRQKHFGRGRTEWVDPNPITPEAMAAADIPDAPVRDGALAKAPTSDAFEKIRRTA